MYSPVIIQRLRMLIVVLTTIVFVSAPMMASAEIIHHCDDQIDVCASFQTPGDEPNDDRSHEGHEHHAHHCGGCHFHMIGNGALPFNIKQLQSQHLIPAQPFPASVATGGLFRPPRA